MCLTKKLVVIFTATYIAGHWNCMQGNRELQSILFLHLYFSKLSRITVGMAASSYCDKTFANAPLCKSSQKWTDWRPVCESVGSQYTMLYRGIEEWSCSCESLFRVLGPSTRNNNSQDHGKQHHYCISIKRDNYNRCHRSDKYPKWQIVGLGYGHSNIILLIKCLKPN